MARYVLVHGAFMGAWCWDEVATLLSRAGHRVDAIDLPGAGDDPAPPGRVTLRSCVDRVCSVLACGPPAILVGHSLGGVVITAAAARSGPLIERLGYVAAFVPAHGESGRATADDADGERLRRRLTVAGDPPVVTVPPAAARELLFSRCDGATAERAIARLRPHPAAVSGTPVDLRGVPTVPRHYLVCTGDQAIDPARQRQIAVSGGCAVTEIDADHCPFLSAPVELSAALAAVHR
jgi:pimeloyl-ACP methyl ester carboxylesterase